MRQSYELQHGTVHLMPVPKTSVNKNHDAVFAQYDIRSSRQPLYIFAVTVATGEEVTAHDPFRFRVLALDFRHDGGTLLLTPNIHTLRFDMAKLTNLCQFFEFLNMRIHVIVLRKKRIFLCTPFQDTSVSFSWNDLFLSYRCRF